MHQQRHGREAVIVIRELARMFLTVHEIGDETLKRFKHANRHAQA
jgi:hypothetical protein